MFVSDDLSSKRYRIDTLELKITEDAEQETARKKSKKLIANYQIYFYTCLGLAFLQVEHSVQRWS